MGNSGNNNQFILTTLHNIKDEFDVTMKYMRRKMEERPVPSLAWIFKPFWKALISFKAPLNKEDAKTLVNNLLGSPYFTLLFGLVFGLEKIPALTKIITTNNVFLYGMVISYLVSVYCQFSKLTIIGDKNFDIHAYAILRKKEYQLFLAYKEANPFTFAALYDHLRDLTNQTVIQLQRLTDHNLTKDTKLWEKDEEIKRLKETLLREQEVGKDLAKKAAKLINEYQNQTFLLNHTLDAIQSINREVFSKDHLRVITDYSLFEEREGKLYRIAYHKTANTPIIIDPHESKYENWAVCRALHTDANEIELQESHGRVVASKRFTDHNKNTYVYSFHFYDTEKEKYDILELEGLHRLLYILILYYKRTPAYDKEVELLEKTIGSA